MFWISIVRVTHSVITSLQFIGLTLYPSRRSITFFLPYLYCRIIHILESQPTQLIPKCKTFVTKEIFGICVCFIRVWIELFHVLTENHDFDILRAAVKFIYHGFGNILNKWSWEMKINFIVPSIDRISFFWFYSNVNCWCEWWDYKCFVLMRHWMMVLLEKMK